MANSDSINQSEIYQAVYRAGFRTPAESDNYMGREYQELSLTELKKQFENNSSTQAIKTLTDKRAQIQLRSEDLYEHGNPLAVWKGCSDMRFDYICAIGNTLGLDAALPDRTSDPGEYNFKMQIQPHISFSGKYAQLGADQKEGLLRIGSRSGGEEVYIYMCPEEVFQPGYEVPEPGFCSGPTRMSAKHARILTAFLAVCLSEIRDTGTGSYITNDCYEIPLPPEPMTWTFTNAL